MPVLIGNLQSDSRGIPTYTKELAVCGSVKSNLKLFPKIFSATFDYTVNQVNRKGFTCTLAIAPNVDQWHGIHVYNLVATFNRYGACRINNSALHINPALTGICSCRMHHTRGKEAGKHEKKSKFIFHFSFSFIHI
ncbi:hypothetical protein AZZ64_004678 [Enterobacter cloacae]|nr:hypothetical protein AZZ64_004678 [Enterobacter cloacae]